MNFFKNKTEDPVVLIKRKVDKLIKRFDENDVPYILQGHHRDPNDIEAFEDYIRGHGLDTYLSDKDKHYCVNHHIEFSTMRYHNILIQISKGFALFIKHKGQPSAADLVAKANSIVAWSLFHLYYNDILKGD
jgi:hypothetical protein